MSSSPSIVTVPRLVMVLSLLWPRVVSKTDLTGCTTTDVSSPAGASVAWYVPGTGERCDFLDCGGGAGPPRYDVPGCPMYTGTATYSPSYLDGYNAPAATATPTATDTDTSSIIIIMTRSGTSGISSVSPVYSAHTESAQGMLSAPDAPVITSTTGGFDTTVTGSSATITVPSASQPLICALQSSSDPSCGVDVSTTTYPGSTVTSAVTSDSGTTSSNTAQSSSGLVVGNSSSRSLSSQQSSSKAGSNATPSSTGSAVVSSASPTNVNTGAAAAFATRSSKLAAGVGMVAAALGALIAM
ncbi:hypothetical protein AAFC00_002984 [Neodothiora populina]|uniref:Uncharacterized protein n=1 Tax=Neodothiora populina TaxID=2781224 RepID=A0ABR3P957_9PEZI